MSSYIWEGGGGEWGLLSVISSLVVFFILNVSMFLYSILFGLKPTSEIFRLNGSKWSPALIKLDTFFL